MAVYTPLTHSEIEAFLSYYTLGKLQSYQAIAEGIENSNYLIHVSVSGAPGGKPERRSGLGRDNHMSQKFILTIYEARVNPADLPFFLGLTEWLADRGLKAPRPIHGRDGAKVYPLKGKKAALIEFLDGKGNPDITPRHLNLTGQWQARMHLAAESFPLSRRNQLSVAGWWNLFQKIEHTADFISPGLSGFINNELKLLELSWPTALPKGVIHADVFPDNVFFKQHGSGLVELAGVIDFYFACHDFWMYDLAITLNAWCFDSTHQFQTDRAQALFAGYQSVRELTLAEKNALPILARGSALRFLLTRAYDWMNKPVDALVTAKDPAEYIAKLQFHQRMKHYSDYGLS